MITRGSFIYALAFMHSLGVVICNFDVEDIRAETARVMAPFYSGTEVPEYIEKYPASFAAKLMAARGVHSIEALALSLQQDVDRDFFVQDGIVMSYTTLNPMGRWDYYVVGGCYNGWISDHESFLAAAERDWDEQVCRNVARPSTLSQDKLPSVIVTPEGDWYDSFDHGWRMIAPDHEKEKAWQSWVAFALPLLRSYRSHIGLGLDIHS